MLALLERGLSERAPWRITRRHQGLHGLQGKGKQVVDNFSATPAKFVLKGTITRP
jgi:hypothetical protein